MSGKMLEGGETRDACSDHFVDALSGRLRTVAETGVTRVDRARLQLFAQLDGRGDPQRG